MPMPSLSKLTIKGFKSIRELEGLELRRLNVLIGANGAGKSNFISFFRLLHELIEGRLQLHVGKQGGPDRLLYYGRRETPRLEATFYFGQQGGYSFRLEPTTDERLIFADESLWHAESAPQSIGSSHAESLTPARRRPGDPRVSALAEHVVTAIQNWRVYHFHDTSELANIKRPGAINDNLFLRLDAGNLAAFLYRLKVAHPESYERILDAVRLVMPAFNDFLLRPWPLNPDTISLEWTESGSDYAFLSHQLSDGTLRFICLATLLLQPELPAIIIIDEPELGLHPVALGVFASLLRSASTRTKLIVATQSAMLVDALQPEDVVVVERSQGQSVFKRLTTADLEGWLEEYSLGELWLKNVLGGRPSR